RGDEFFQRGDRLGIAQSSQRVDGGQLNRFLRVVQAVQQEFADAVLFLFVARQISQRCEPLSETATGKPRFPLCERLDQRRNEARLILQTHGGDGGVGEFVAIGRRLQIFQQRGLHFRPG